MADGLTPLRPADPITEIKTVMDPSTIVYLNPHCPDHGSAEAVTQPHSSGTPGCGCIGGDR